MPGLHGYLSQSQYDGFSRSIRWNASVIAPLLYIAEVAPICSLYLAMQFYRCAGGKGSTGHITIGGEGGEKMAEGIVELATRTPRLALRSPTTCSER